MVEAGTGHCGPDPTRDTRPGAAAWLALALALLLLRALANAALWRSGFVAISDDDFARDVIAQSFAHDPRWDPSGTSWLPFAFWLPGSLHLLFGNTLGVAHATAFGLSLVSTLLCLLAARTLGLGLLAAGLAAALCSTLPHSLWLGLATVPEGYAAAASLFALASLTRYSPRTRGFGALALLCASLSRYEFWPLCVAFAAFTLLDVQRARLPRIAALHAGLSLSGIMAWLLHGAASHGDALFFLKRVSDYTRALGEQAPLLERLMQGPLLLFRAEPEVVSLAALGAVLCWPERRSLTRYQRPMLCAGMLLGFVSAGAALGGAATHHPERPLLLIWLLLALFCADAWLVLLANGRRRPALGVLGGAAVLLLALRGSVLFRQPFVDRSAEIAIGQLARTAIAGQPGPLVVDCVDYGYLAVIAALGQPQARPLRTHDPRQTSEPPVAPLLRGARWLIADRKSPLAEAPPGPVVAQTPSFVLISLAQGG